jgi:fructokinase
MRKVFTIGETVYDIIFKNGRIQTGKAGGSMLNSSVSLGLLGIDVSFISEIGADQVGELINKFLIKNHVSTNFIYLFEDGKTPIALAFLDENQNAAYSFYKIYPGKRLQQPFPEITSGDIVLFGSFFSLSPQVRQPLIGFIKKARASGAIIIYDPNIRKSHKSEIPELQNLIYENISLADIIRGSDEDFKTMFGVNNFQEATEIFKNSGNQIFIYTAGGDNVRLFSNNATSSFSVPDIIPLSTIGAGDNFNAGIIYALLKQNIFRKDLNNLPSDQWYEIINTGIELSQEVCKSYNNYISASFAKRFVKRK